MTGPGVEDCPSGDRLQARGAGALSSGTGAGQRPGLGVALQTTVRNFFYVCVAFKQRVCVEKPPP